MDLTLPGFGRTSNVDQGGSQPGYGGRQRGGDRNRYFRECEEATFALPYEAVGPPLLEFREWCVELFREGVEVTDSVTGEVIGGMPSLDGEYSELRELFGQRRNREEGNERGEGSQGSGETMGPDGVSAPLLRGSSVQLSLSLLV